MQSPPNLNCGSSLSLPTLTPPKRPPPPLCRPIERPLPQPPLDGDPSQEYDLENYYEIYSEIDEDLMQNDATERCSSRFSDCAKSFSESVNSLLRDSDLSQEIFDTIHGKSTPDLPTREKLENTFAPEENYDVPNECTRIPFTFFMNKNNLENQNRSCNVPKIPAKVSNYCADAEDDLEYKVPNTLKCHVLDPSDNVYQLPPSNPIPVLNVTEHYLKEKIVNTTEVEPLKNNTAIKENSPVCNEPISKVNNSIEDNSLIKCDDINNEEIQKTLENEKNTGTSPRSSKVREIVARMDKLETEKQSNLNNNTNSNVANIKAKVLKICDDNQESARNFEANLKRIESLKNCAQK